MLPHPAGDVEIAIKTRPDDLDLRAIAVLTILAWGGEVNDGTVDKKVKTLRKRIGGVGPDRQGMIVARVAGQVIGYCRTSQDKADASCWWLEWLIVHPDYRRREVGRTAVYWAVALASARGATLMRSETHADNDASIAFHERLGFRNNGPFTDSDGDMQVAFSLDLETFHAGQAANSYDDRHVAESYDQTETQTDDVALLGDLIGEGKAWRILEPFCGSGRMLIPLAQAGHAVIGMELAPAMLEMAQAKVAVLPHDAKQRVTLVRSDATTTNWPGDVDLVVLGGNCFYELGTVRQQEGCIARAAKALKGGGWLYVDNDHMEGPLPASWQRPGKGTTPFPGGLCRDGTRTQGASETVWTDPDSRIWLARRGITVIRPDGSAHTREWIQWKHPVSKDEAAGWLAKHGFVIDRLLGDRAGHPYAPASPRAVFWARKEPR